MAYFAELDETNTVVRVISVNNNDCAGGDFPTSEPAGQAFIANVLKLGGVWKQTSYNGNFRSKYAGIGDVYDAETDTFISPAQE